MFDDIIEFIQSLYPQDNPVPLHAPRFKGNEKKYLVDCIDSTYVSYVGEYVDRFEEQIKDYTGARHAVAVSSGTAALHMALLLADVRPGEEVITQPLTFVATANAISYCGAQPVFVDVEKSTLGLDPQKLDDFLRKNSIAGSDGHCYNKVTKKKISACVPMHTFGHPAKIDAIMDVCEDFNIPVIEDAAEALGSFYKGQHAGTFGAAGILSFNGNKPVTTGGGGMLITNNKSLALKAKHLTTTAKASRQWEFFHDQVGYNYRMPNINAAVGCAQLEFFDATLENKRHTAKKYQTFFRDLGIPYISEPAHSRSNYWLNAIFLDDSHARDQFLDFSNRQGVQTRPVWTLMNHLPMYKHCQSGPLDNAQWIEQRLVNLPSSERI